MAYKRTGLWYSCCVKATLLVGCMALAVYLLAALIGG